MVTFTWQEKEHKKSKNKYTLLNEKRKRNTKEKNDKKKITPQAQNVSNKSTSYGHTFVFFCRSNTSSHKNYKEFDDP